MKIFFFDAYERSDVDASEAIEASESEAQNIFARLNGTDAYIGIFLEDDRVLHLREEESGLVYAEILNSKNRSIRFCTVNAPLAELLIEAAYRKENFEEKIGFARLTWTDGVLKS